MLCFQSALALPSCLTCTTPYEGEEAGAEDLGLPTSRRVASRHGLCVIRYGSHVDHEATTITYRLKFYFQTMQL